MLGMSLSLFGQCNEAQQNGQSRWWLCPLHRRRVALRACPERSEGSLSSVVLRVTTFLGQPLMLACFAP